MWWKTGIVLCEKSKAVYSALSSLWEKFTEINPFHRNPVMWDYLGKLFYQPVKRPEHHWSNETSLATLILGKIFPSSFSICIWIMLPSQKNWMMGVWEEVLPHWFTPCWAAAWFVYRISHAIFPSITFEVLLLIWDNEE